MIPVEVKRVAFDENTQMGVVVLKEINGDRFLPIWVGIYEAYSIEMKLMNRSTSRPMTHDLLLNCIERLNAHVNYVYINKLQGNVFFAEIHLSQNEDDEIIIDSRPSDAIALSVRTGAPIYVSEDIFLKNGVSKEELELTLNRKVPFRIDFGDIRH